jgi:alcohol dehydrogenase class IV
MLLPAVMGFSLSGNLERYADVGVAMAVQIAGADSVTLAEAGVAAVRDLCNELDIPSLGGYGLDPVRVLELAPRMAEDAIKSGSPGNNPREASVQEIVSLYKAVL